MRKVFASAGQLFLLALTVFLGACYSPSRSPFDGGLPPAFDPARRDWETSVERLADMDMQLPSRRDYAIGPGDVLSLTFVGRPDLLGPTGNDQEGYEITVSDSPTITLPYIGAITVHGKTTDQLQQEIKVAYSPFIKDPVPVVRIKKYYANQVTVLGSIREPGRYELAVGDTVLDAIFKAGGLTFGGRTGGLPPARILKIYREKVTQKQRVEMEPEALLRLLQDDGRIVPREEIVLPLDEFILGGDLRYNIPLRPYDVIYVPPAGTISINGNVRNPRVVFLGPSLRTLVQVITETGGLDFKARSIAEVVRTHPNGSTESYFVNVRDMMRRKQPDLVLEDNDQIFIYKSNWRTFAAILGDVFASGTRAGVNATYNPL
jgi:polysaccharide export outer membrane protein